MTKFSKGDRVKYVGTFTPRLTGKYGTVVEWFGWESVAVDWDDAELAKRGPGNVMSKHLELATAISIKPARAAEIVGAKIGDRVSWVGALDGLPYYGTIAGIDIDRLEIDTEGPSFAGQSSKRYIAPHRVSLAPKKFKVGDEVAPEDYDLLPDGAVCVGGGYLPTTKVAGAWQLISNKSISPIDPRIAGRTIAYLPAGYERKEKAAA